MKPIRSTCESCGAGLKWRDGDTTTTCEYCGNEYSREGNGIVKELQEIARQEIARIAHQEHLGEVALSVGNHADLERSARQILDLDSAHGRAWLWRTIVVYGHATHQNTRCKEIRKYLKEAVNAGEGRGASVVLQKSGEPLFEAWFGQAAELSNGARGCYQTGDRETGNQRCLEAMQYGVAAVEIAPDEDRAYQALVLMASLAQLSPTLWQSPPAQLAALEPLRIKRRLMKELRNWEWMQKQVRSWRGQVQQEPYLPAVLENVLKYILGLLTRKVKEVSERIRQQDVALNELGEALSLPWLAVRTSSSGTRP